MGNYHYTDTLLVQQSRDSWGGSCSADGRQVNVVRHRDYSIFHYHRDRSSDHRTGTNFLDPGSTVGADPRRNPGRYAWSSNGSESLYTIDGNDQKCYAGTYKIMAVQCRNTVIDRRTGTVSSYSCTPVFNHKHLNRCLGLLREWTCIHIHLRAKSWSSCSWHQRRAKKLVNEFQSKLVRAIQVLIQITFDNIRQWLI